MEDFAAVTRRYMKERGMSLRTLARAIHYDPSYLSKTLNGLKPVTPRLAEAADGALNAGGEIRQAAASAEPYVTPRREASRLPRHAVTVADVEAVEITTTMFRSLDNKFGGAHAHALAAGYLDTSVALMLRTGSFTENIGRQLFGAAAQLAHLAAWSAYDIDDPRRSETYFGRALELASAAGDAAFAGEVLAARSHRAIHLGQPRRAIELARASHHTAGAAALGVVAEAHELEANGHALLGDSAACVNSLRKCESAFAQANAATAPAWLGYLNRAYLAARFAHTFRDLGDYREAERHAVEASAISGDFARTRALNATVLATVYVEIDLDRALGTGSEAVDMTARLQSGRAVKYVTDFRRRLQRRYPADPQVREFEDKARAVLGSER